MRKGLNQSLSIWLFVAFAALPSIAHAGCREFLELLHEEKSGGLLTSDAGQVIAKELKDLGFIRTRELGITEFLLIYSDLFKNPVISHTLAQATLDIPYLSGNYEGFIEKLGDPRLVSHTDQLLGLTYDRIKHMLENPSELPPEGVTKKDFTNALLLWSRLKNHFISKSQAEMKELVKEAIGRTQLFQQATSETQLQFKRFFPGWFARQKAALRSRWQGSAPRTLVHEAEPTQTLVQPGPTRSNFEVFEKLAREQGIDPEFLKIANPKSFEFVEIPPGNYSFMMGSPQTEEGRFYDERQHRVTVTGGWEVAKTQLTQLPFRLLMGDSPSKFSGPEYSEGDGMKIGDEHLNANHPAENQPADVFDEFVRRMNDLGDGYEYSLLPEARWEFMAKAGGSQTTQYPHGNTEYALKKSGWFSGNSNSRTHAVALKEPNAWGIYDTSGNVWEFTKDTFINDPPSGVDPWVPPQPGSPRAVRGGSWLGDAQYCRSSVRHYVGSGLRYDRVGARLMRTRKP